MMEGEFSLTLIGAPGQRIHSLSQERVKEAGAGSRSSMSPDQYAPELTQSPL